MADPTAPSTHDPEGREQASRVPPILRALRHRTYRVLLITSLVTMTGFWMSTVALQWVTARLTDSDPFLLGLLYFFNLVPLLLFSMVGGGLADKHDRRRVLVRGHLATATLAGGLVLSMTLFGVHLPVLFAFAFGVGSALALMGPAGGALNANAVPLTDLPSAISLHSAGMNLSRMAGPAAATPLLVAYGPRPAFAAYMATSLVSAVAISRLRIHQAPLPTDDASMRRRMMEGLRYVRARPTTTAAISMVATTALFGSSYIPLLPVYAYTILDGGDAAFSMLFILSGLGAFLGALLTGMSRSAPSLGGLLATMLLIAASLAGFALSRVLLLSYVLILIVAGANFALMTAINTLLQTTVDDEQRGRIMSLYLLAWGGLVPIGAVGIGVVANVLGPPAAILLFAGVVAAAGTVGLAWHRQRTHHSPR